MNSWSETITLPALLREVRLAESPSPTTAADEAVQASFQAGFEQGRLAGEKALSEQLLKQRAELQEILQGTLQSLRDAVPQVVRDTENMMVSLALEVAQKLVSDMPISVPAVEAAVREALTHVESSAHVTIRLHPADLELLQNAASPLLQSSDGSSDFRFFSSSDVSRGGCLVETRFGTIDARRETKFDLIKQSLAP